MKGKKNPAKKMKTSGSESVFTDFFYSSPPGKTSNNCYSYAIDYYGEDDGHKLQPGELAHVLADNDLSSCKELRRRAMRDNPHMRPVAPDAACPRGTYKVWLFLDQKNDYHWYRQHEDVLIRLSKKDTPGTLAKTFGVPPRNVVLPHKGSFALVKNAKVWSHKRGLATGSILRDACHRIITDPRRACRDYGEYNYRTDCGPFCTQNRMYEYDLPNPKRPTKSSPRRRSTAV